VSDPGIPRLAWNMGKRFALAAVVIVVLSAATTATAGLLEVRDYATALEKGTPRLDVAEEITPAEAGAPQTILLLGSDVRLAERRQGLRGNSDTMILVRLDPYKRANSVLSVPRDLKVQLELPNGAIRTDKINASYREGGPRLTAKTIKDVLGIEIHHIINVNFKAFKAAVNRIGCVYVDIDRRYFNANPYAYAIINVRPGYQKMCGEKALDYVRFRHEDNDLVRAARQQDFLRQAKDQVGVRRTITDRKAFAELFARYTETDIRGSTDILGLFKLVAFSIGQPVREVKFRTTLGPSYVSSTEAQIRASVDEFLNAEGTPGPRGRLTPSTAPRQATRKRRPLPKAAIGLEDAKRFGEDQAIAAATKVRFPVLYPRLRVQGSLYVDLPRTYVIQDEEGRPHSAYRMVIKKGGFGEYYGVQGMTWKEPPILSNPSETRRVGGRSFMLFYDGDRLRLVAWKTPRAVYWVSNTLLLTLNNRQMLAIARSLQPVT
jgi:LCP family protein required for cell wall assembly